MSDGPDQDLVGWVADKMITASGSLRRPGAWRGCREGAEQIVVHLAQHRTMVGSIETQVRADIAALGQLSGARATYAELAYRLAQSLDAERGAEDTTGVAGLARELRAALEAIWAGRRNERLSDGIVSTLGQPVRTQPAVSAAVRDVP